MESLQPEDSVQKQVFLVFSHTSRLVSLDSVLSFYRVSIRIPQGLLHLANALYLRAKSR